MRLYKKLKFLLWTILLSSPLFAQIQSVAINLEVLNPNAQIFVVGDFRSSFLTTSYFLLNLNNTGQNAVRMKFEIRVLYNGTEIARGESDFFDLPGNNPMLSYGNQQLSVGVIIPGSEPPYNIIRVEELEVDLSAVENLENQILATGKLPSGAYSFIVIAEDMNGNTTGDSDPSNNTLNITNPTTLELRFPGLSISESTIQEIATTFPYCQWQADVFIDPASPGEEPPYYNIFMYEKFPEDESAQDVLSHPAILQVEKYKLNFLQYPTESNPTLLSGRTVGPVRLLEAGKIYYWLVQSVIPTSTGDYIITSDIFRFKVLDLTQSSIYGPQILSLLEQILGPNYWPVLQQLRDNGFEPNGKIYWDRNEIEVSDLLLLLGRFTSGEAEIKKVEIY